MLYVGVALDRMAVAAATVRGIYSSRATDLRMDIGHLGGDLSCDSFPSEARLQSLFEGGQQQE